MYNGVIRVIKHLMLNLTHVRWCMHPAVKGLILHYIYRLTGKITCTNKNSSIYWSYQFEELITQMRVCTTGLNYYKLDVSVLVNHPRLISWIGFLCFNTNANYLMHRVFAPVFQLGCMGTVTHVSARVWEDSHPYISKGSGRVTRV